MTIEVSPELEAQLLARAEAEGVSVGAYVERLLQEEDSRRDLSGYQQLVRERTASAEREELVDGEEVMARLMEELDASDQGASRK